MNRVSSILSDPGLRMQICGIVALIGTAMSQVWHDHAEIVRIGTFLTSVGASAGVLMARHRHVTDQESGATTYMLRKKFKQEPPHHRRPDRDFP